MKPNQAKKRKTDAQTAYLRSEIQKLKKRWAEIKAPEEASPSSDASGSQPESSRAGAESNTLDHSSERESSSHCYIADNDDDVSPNSSGQDDETESRRMPNPIRFADEMFDETPDLEAVEEWQSNASVVTRSETYIVDTDTDDEANSLCTPAPLKPKSFSFDQTEFLISSNNLNFFTGTPSDGEFPELESSMEVLRDLSKDTYTSNSPMLAFNPTVFSSPKPGRIEKLKGNVVKHGTASFEPTFSKNVLGFQRSIFGSATGNDAMLDSPTPTQLPMKRYKPAISSTSAIEFSVYPTPTSREGSYNMDPVFEVTAGEPQAVIQLIRRSTRKQPPPGPSQAAKQNPTETQDLKAKVGKRTRKNQTRRIKRKPKVTKPSVKTMARAQPKMLGRRQTQKVQHICEICSKSFATRGQLQHHAHESHRTFEITCKVCQKTDFGSLRIFNRHMNTCQFEVKSFVCETCEDQFEDDSQLALHSSIHDTPKFVCETCEAEFQDNVSLQEHVNSVHKKANRFHCKLCHLSYSRPDGLKRHVNNNHPENKA